MSVFCAWHAAIISDGVNIAPANTGANSNCHGSSNTTNDSDKKNALAIWLIPPSRPISDTFIANNIVRQ